MQRDYKLPDSKENKKENQTKTTKQTPKYWDLQSTFVIAAFPSFVY